MYNEENLKHENCGNKNNKAKLYRYTSKQVIIKVQCKLLHCCQI